MELNRRQFVGASSVAGLGVAGVAALASARALADEAKVADVPAEEPSATYDCDVVIVGCGISGLSAAVQAGELGLNTIALEAGEQVGGNGQGVEGIFGCGTSGQIEQGIELDSGAIVRHELEQAQHLPDGTLWTDLVKASAENYDWLVEQGVEFSGVINDYGGLYPTMHWFGGDKAGIGYVPHMEGKAEEYGVQFMRSTAAQSLRTDADGRVCGVTATDADGATIQVNASAVILASGGFGYNDDMLAAWGFNLEHLGKVGNPLNNGDGIRMALAVGAQDCTADACFLAAPNIDGLFAKGDASGKLGFGGPVIWVNQDGERFVNEDLAADNIMSVALPTITQKQCYCLLDSTILGSILNGPRSVTAATDVPADEEFASVLEECPSDNVYQCDTIAEVAEKFGIDAEALQATVDAYNVDCAVGTDSYFGKDASQMLPVENGPFTMFRLDVDVMVAIGGLGTNRNMQVLAEDGTPIEGLYAIGVDGVRLYRKVYPINIGATCCGNNVNSGRIAVRHIASLL